MIRRAFLGLVASAALVLPTLANADPEADALRESLDLVLRRDWDGAEAAARPAGPVGRDVIEWMRLRAGQGTLEDYVAFLRRRPDWPGLPLLRAAGEKVLAESGSPDEVRAYFAHHAPQTAKGAIALQKVLLAAGDRKRAEAAARTAWATLVYGADDQEAQLALMGRVLVAHHVARLDMLLWEGRLTEAGRMLDLVAEGPKRLAQARIALQSNAPGVDALVDQVPAREAGDAGLAHDRFIWRYYHDFNDSAEELLLQRSTSVASLGRPEDWARVRAALARDEMRSGDAKKAYRIAANHHLKDGAAYADLEFVAGYVALMRLKDPKTAYVHFTRLERAVSTPISLGRAYYWQGRALEAMRLPDKAAAALRKGARYQSAFYGQMAAERLGLPLDPSLLGHERYPDWRRQPFLSSSLVRAGLLLVKAGDRPLATRFFLQLTEGLKTAELGPLSDLALAVNEPHIALRIAKAAADRGVILPRPYFPMSDLAKLKLAVPPALALSIARRESEFNVSVISPAGARGLMQVMPGTAKLMSEAIGVGYDKGRLTSDGDYNARLGAAYLAKLVDEFGPALTLVTAGYNAGPKRPEAWIQVLGDPRTKTVDPIDWIEEVPFTETRNYIMRVSEAYTIYRARIEGKAGRIRLYESLKGE
ncbi:lytic transglycosylase domain-containing protein [Acidimangrovimonas sediminis]|uniref:lytic transglycosylase domain-containing protein n=1 Tax=Acidimangrovimonas sediminis TaxID=2056283 RepID=UPI001E28CE12|nr:lytic transglycosylase domain-containing protein [Acidimangrovimonas sediminis]